MGKIWDFLTKERDTNTVHNSTTGERKEDIMDRLKSYCNMGGGMRDKDGMHEAILEAAEAIGDNGSAEDYYTIGIGYKNYQVWHIRGDERKPYMAKAVSNLQNSLTKARYTLPFESNDDFVWPDQLMIISDLCSLIVNQKLVRDLDTAEPILADAYSRTSDYHPCLYRYFELLYFKKEYEKALDVATELKRRVSKSSSKWRGMETPQKLIEKAERALRRKKM